MSISAALTSLLLAPEALGFCRAHACDPDSGQTCTRDPATQCSNQGVQLSRKNGCFTYGVARGAGFPLGLSDAEVEAIIARAFRKWASADCDGRPPGIVVRTVGVVDATAPFTCGVPSLNLDTWFVTPLTNSNAEMPTNALVAGATVPKFLEATGEIIDADVRLNESFWGALRKDPTFLGLLATTAVHEAGHVLGLAHSQDKAALMFRSYEVTTDRPLAADDVAAICTLYPPVESVTCSEPGVTEAALNQAACDAVAKQSGSGCAMGNARREPTPWAFAVLCVGMIGMLGRRLRWRAARSVAKI